MNKKNIKSTSSVSLDNVSITYGNSVAVKNVFCDIEKNQVTSFILVGVLWTLNILSRWIGTHGSYSKNKV